MSLQHVSVSGYLLGEVIKPPSNAQHWSKASSRAGATGAWRRNLAGDVSIVSQASTREREKKKRKERQGKSSRRAKIPLLGLHA